jgi:hypothetical protein
MEQAIKKGWSFFSTLFLYEHVSPDSDLICTPLGGQGKKALLGLFTST